MQTPRLWTTLVIGASPDDIRADRPRLRDAMAYWCVRADAQNTRMDLRVEVTDLSSSLRLDRDLDFPSSASFMSSLLRPWVDRIRRPHLIVFDIRDVRDLFSLEGSKCEEEEKEGRVWTFANLEWLVIELEASFPHDPCVLTAFQFATQLRTASIQNGMAEEFINIILPWRHLTSL